MFDTATSPYKLFTNRQLVKLIVPLVIEQALAMLIGMADTVMVTSISESAVSAVSLVDNMNLLLIQLFSAMAAGGAIVVAQYLGKGDKAAAGSSSKQLVHVTMLISLVIAALAIVFCDPLLVLCFGRLSEGTMDYCRTYLYLSALSFPALAVYNGCAAVLRAMRNSRASMTTSILMNLINVGGNALLIYGFRMEVAGAGIASLVARMAGAVVMARIMLKPGLPVELVEPLRIRLDFGMIKKIFKLGIPNGVENSMFQVGRLMVLGMVSPLGETIIAANAVSNTIATAANLMGSAMNLAVVTVIGQCVGAGDEKQTRYYARKLITVLYLFNAVIYALLFFYATPITQMFNLSPEAVEASVEVLRWFAVASFVLWPMSFMLPAVLRAAGDVRYTLCVSMSTMWLGRILSSYIMVNMLGMGLLGVWLGMLIDWLGRSICVLPRYLGTKWLAKRVV